MLMDCVRGLEVDVGFLATFFAGVSLGFKAVFLTAFFAVAFLVLTAVFPATVFFAGIFAVIVFLLSGVMILSCRLMMDSLDWQILYLCCPMVQP